SLDLPSLDLPSLDLLSFVSPALLSVVLVSLLGVSAAIAAVAKKKEAIKTLKKRFIEYPPCLGPVIFERPDVAYRPPRRQTPSVRSPIFHISTRRLAQNSRNAQLSVITAVLDAAAAVVYFSTHVGGVQRLRALWLGSRRRGVRRRVRRIDDS